MWMVLLNYTESARLNSIIVICKLLILFPHVSFQPVIDERAQERLKSKEQRQLWLSYCENTMPLRSWSDGVKAKKLHHMQSLV